MSHDNLPPLKKDTAGLSPGSKRSNMAALVVGFPLVAVFAVALALLVRAFGYHPARGDLELTSVVAIVIGTRLIILFRDQLGTPSRLLLTLSTLGYLLIMALIWARLTHRLPNRFLDLQRVTAPAVVSQARWVEWERERAYGRAGGQATVSVTFPKSPVG